MLDGIIHPNTRTLLEAWQRMDSASEDFSPRLSNGHEAELVDSLFVIQAAPTPGWMFRSAGSRLAAMLGGDCTQRDFLGLWVHADRARMQAILAMVTGGRGPAVILSEVTSQQGLRLRAEIALAQLPIGPGPEPRILGLYQVLDAEPRATRSLQAGHSIKRYLTRREATGAPSLRVVARND